MMCRTSNAGLVQVTPALLTGLVFVYSDSVRQPLNSSSSSHEAAIFHLLETHVPAKQARCGFRDRAESRHQRGGSCRMAAEQKILSAPGLGTKDYLEDQGT